MKILNYSLFFLLPLIGCNIPIPIYLSNNLQLSDPLRIIFVIFFIYFIFTNNKELNNKFFYVFRKMIIFFFIFSFLNITGLIFSLLKDGNKISGFDIISFPFTFLYFYLFVFYVLFTLDFKYNLFNYNRIVYISTSIVVVICLLQITTIVLPNSFISNFYNDVLFYIVEGRWGGWVSIDGNYIGNYYSLSVNQPISSLIYRVSGTFPEPSVLVMFLSLISYPTIIQNYFIKRQYSDLLLLFLITLCMIFSFSTTGYLLLLYTLICSFIFIYKDKSTRIFISIIIVIFFIFMMIIYPELFQIFDKISNISSESSSTRYGSIVAAINFIIDGSYPLGVGYGKHIYHLFDYLPIWGHTDENASGIVVVHSVLIKYLVDFGLLSFPFIFVLLSLILKKILKLFVFNSDISLQIWLGCFLILLFTNLSVTHLWFLVSVYYYFFRDSIYGKNNI